MNRGSTTTRVVDDNTDTGQRKTICVVDDDTRFAHVLAEALSDEGYRAVSATNSLRALDVLIESKPDLVIMDIMMPFLDGLDQIKLMSLREDLCNVPIIVITAKARALDGVSDLEKLRIVGYFYKPFEFSDLLIKVAEELKKGNFPRSGDSSTSVPPAFLF